jgi:hypothetical protein
MQHIRQVGGTKKVHGTSISREMTKGFLSLMVLLVLGVAVKSDKLGIRERLGYANQVLYKTCREAVTRLRSLT